MPDPIEETKKKVLVKVVKKTAKKTTEPKAEMEAYVPKGLTKENIAKINETSDVNQKRRDIEGMAKNDSITGAKKAKFDGKDLVDQERAGNKVANDRRKKEGIPQVAKGREYVNNAELKDKYSTGVYTSTRDYYSRNEPLEKDMPVIKKTMVKVKKT
jgi:hypothetical protein